MRTCESRYSGLCYRDAEWRYYGTRQAGERNRLVLLLCDQHAERLADASENGRRIWTPEKGVTLPRQRSHGYDRSIWLVPISHNGATP